MIAEHSVELNFWWGVLGHRDHSVYMHTIVSFRPRYNFDENPWPPKNPKLNYMYTEIC